MSRLGYLTIIVLALVTVFIRLHTPAAPVKEEPYVTCEQWASGQETVLACRDRSGRTFNIIRPRDNA